jgi:AraC family transcriptional regulator
MSERAPLTVDFRNTQEMLQLLPQPAQRSSKPLGWPGIHVQDHYQPAWETPEYHYASHMILVHGATHPMRVERWFDGRHQEEQMGGENNVVIVPAMTAHRANWAAAGPFALLFLEPDYLMHAAREMTRTDPVELRPHHAMPDPFVEHIGKALIAELNVNLGGSRLLVDSLTTALSIHLLRNYANLRQPLRAVVGGLSPLQLQQVVDFIQVHLAEDLTIGAIAELLEMSPYYFSRLFKQSMGLSPYQYVIQQRVERAALLLRTTALSIAAIATQVGFPNQNQLTIQFRKLMNTTPSHYRKHL